LANSRKRELGVSVPDSMNNPIRTFFAVDPSAEVHRRLVEMKALLADSDAAVRWVRDDGLHMTVKFLGPISPETLGRLREALRPCGPAFRPFSLRMRGLGVFPNPRQPRIVWAGVDSDELPRLARLVEEAAARFGFEPERRAFRPHITVGRVKGTRGWPRLQEMLQAHGNDDFGECEVTELIAYSSHLRPSGAVYTKLWTIPFEKPT
jgi:RNA 2',3'-cyclic 3'-phosphodiesterase